MSYAVQIKIRDRWTNWAIRKNKDECQKAIEENKNILSNCEYRIRPHHHNDKQNKTK